MSAKARARVLVVDDQPEMTGLLHEELTDLGYEVDVAHSAKEALALAQRRLPDVAITDLRMEGADGLDVMAGLKGLDPGLPVLIMTAFGALESAIEAIKRGAYHYVTKPFVLSEILVFVERALEERRVRDENLALRRIAREGSQLAGMVGDSAAMRTLRDCIERVAVTDASVLVRGESGTGKELVARALHFFSPRRDRAFVAVNCTSIPEALLESELFGHARGAFTGAATARRGLFTEADGGTLFLDEIGDMPLELQAKLLRVLEDGLVRSVGSDTVRTVDVRVVAATHQGLEDRVAAGKFRADLFYRLNVVPIVVPPLHERADDIPLLVEHFLARAREKTPTAKVEAFSPEALAALTRHRWPGNVRELENVVRRVVIMGRAARAELTDVEALAPIVASPESPLGRAKANLMSLRELEDEYLAFVMQHCDNNKTRAAEILGVDISTIYRRGRAAK